MTTESTIDINTGLHPFDDTVRASLRGAHRRASWVGRTGRYDPTVARFVHRRRVDTEPSRPGTRIFDVDAHSARG